MNMSRKNEEKLVVDIINSKLTNNDRKNPLFSIAEELASEIKKDFNKINGCEYIGDDFSDRADILLLTPQKEYVELKVITSSKSGKGTLANTSQDIFSEYNLLNGVMGWSKWRKENSYEQKVLSILNDNLKYTESEKKYILNNEKVIDKNSEIEIKARILRFKIQTFSKKQKIKFKSLPSFIKKFNSNAGTRKNASEEVIIILKTCERIIEHARNDLRGYLDYCAKKEIDKKQFLKFVILLKSGFHTIPLINNNINLSLEKIKTLADNYRIYYYYTKRTTGDHIKKETAMKIKEYYPKNVNDLKVVFENEGLWVFNKEKKIMHMKFHWRNVFFGIAVPSVEIFDRLVNHI